MRSKLFPFSLFTVFDRRKFSSGPRTVITNIGLREANQRFGQYSNRFCDNAVISSRYRWYTFVPQNLFEQFHNIANVFFTVIVIMYVFADGATSVWSTLGPLLAILFMTMAKDGIDDLLRHQRDNALNSAMYTVLSKDDAGVNFRWIKKKAKSLCVGDIIYCEKDRAFPSDIVLLASSNTNTEVNVTTANLDGETNIKKCFAVIKTQDNYYDYSTNRKLELATETRTELANRFYAKITCPEPNDDLNRFEGHISAYPNPENELPLNLSNFVLRGSKLSNTEFAIGVIVYTGKQTKLSLNSKTPTRKYSSRESRANVFLILFTLGMLLMSVTLGVAYTVRTEGNGPQMWYIPSDKTSSWAFVQAVFRFLFIFTYLIPISIIITIDFQQMLFAFYISNDIQMYSAKEDQKSKANSSQLADELGQVEFLFSDKTGTLTQNVMSLQKVAILETNRIYACDNPLTVQEPYLNNYGSDLFSSSSDDSEEECSIDEPPKENIYRLASRTNPESNGSDMSDVKFTEWLTVAALCHTVDCDSAVSLKFPESITDFEDNPVYKACSPDEKAVLEGCSRYGVVYLGSHTGTTNDGTSYAKCYRVKHRTADSSFVTNNYIDAVLDFSAKRKRMSVMVQNHDGTHWVYSKGAETVMLSDQVWILTGDNEETAVTISQASGHFSVDMSIVRLTGYSDFKHATSALFNTLAGLNTRSPGRHILQIADYTHECKASVDVHNSCTKAFDYKKKFVHSSTINPDDNDWLKLPRGLSKQGKDLRSLLLGYTPSKAYFRSLRRHQFHKTYHKHGKMGDNNIGLVIDGETLQYLLHPSLRDPFLELCMRVTTVLYCRMNPLQKAAVVQMVQHGIPKLSGHKPVTAAVGDGGNDVAMLIQATVGIGICGREGREAVRASDYSVSQFRYLKRLFLLHGHLSYHRLSLTMCLFYFKCVALVTTQLLLAFYNGYSQMFSFDSMLFAMYNMTMTSLGSLLYGWFEHPLPEGYLIQWPYLYRKVSNQANLQLWYVCLWVIDGVWHGGTVFYLGMFILVGGQQHGEAIFFSKHNNWERFQFDHGLYGCAVYIILWLSVTIRIVVHSRNLNWMIAVGLLVNCVNVGILMLYERSAGYTSLVYLNFTRLALSPAFWLTFILAVTVANLPDLLWRLLSDTWWSVQIRLSQTPRGHHRKQLRRQPSTWLHALIGERQF